MNAVEANKSSPICFIVEKGSPYEKGTRIPATDNKVIIGRTTYTLSPDLGFDNFLISRRHCCIELNNGSWILSDLGSKHGTTLNAMPLVALTAYALKNGDKIGLASGVAVLRVILSCEFEKTQEFGNTQPISSPETPLTEWPVIIDPTKMTLIVDKQEVSLSTKEWLLLAQLYQQANRFVSYEEIKTAVWSERYSCANGLSSVGIDEINVLIYRLRRKLGVHGEKLRTLRGRGCIFELR